MLRKAGREDIPAIDRCNRAVLAENYTPDLYERLFAEDAAASCFVVEEIEDSVEEVVGYVLLYIEMIRALKQCLKTPLQCFIKINYGNSSSRFRLRSQYLPRSMASTTLRPPDWFRRKTMSGSLEMYGDLWTNALSFAATPRWGRRCTPRQGPLDDVRRRAARGSGGLSDPRSDDEPPGAPRRD